MMPLYSICHTSARPEGWQESYRAWITRADQPQHVEYVLSVDTRWNFARNTGAGIFRPVDRLVWCAGEKTSVAGFNQAAAASSGAVIILNDDDLFPPEHWDTLLNRVILSAGKIPWTDDLAISNTLGDGQIGPDRLGVVILSRARYERLGQVFYPGYISMYPDDDFGAHAQQDGVVIGAKHIKFTHEHPPFPRVETVSANGKETVQVAIPEDYDFVYKHQNSEAAYKQGSELLKRRKANRFTDVSAPIDLSEQPIIDVSLPGPSFSSAWLGSWNSLHRHLMKNFRLNEPHLGYSNNIHYVRNQSAESIAKSDPKPDFVLFIDSDNPVSVNQFVRLYQNLKDCPQLMAVGGWYFVAADSFDVPPIAACGNFSADDCCRPADIQSLYDEASKGNLMSMDYCGFGCLLMRRELLDAVGKNAFTAILSDKYENGQAGDDISFWLRAREACGNVLAIDPMVKVQHLKLGPKEPRFNFITRSRAEELEAERQKAEEMAV